ncbi:MULTISPECIES: hypothetical protein [Rhizobium]|uniref:Uncharacterized protein n=1 Tax=Rhizobium paranaense TaxID=1650438 RepID=A0A7W9CYU3_9HYPH|nr:MULTISPECIES: hypothetical protein [Rhizobium]MBB5571502.1 hypothetical protein [Rhizobium paranaense]PST64054.1 hypothetical protein C9E91_03910 [Rhizobium sp. SEMIA4064]
MIDCIALARIIQLENDARQAQWRRNEDAFYQEYGRDPWALFTWFANALDAGYAWFKTKKADRPDIGRSACDGDDCCGQAASARI